MNKEQQQLYEALLDQNDLARAAGDPFIVDLDTARSLFSAIAEQVDNDTAADICKKISEGYFNEERRAIEGTEEQDGGLMDLIFYEIAMLNEHGRHEIWLATRKAAIALSLGLTPMTQQKVLNYFSRFIKGPRQRKYSEEDPEKFAEELTIISENRKHYDLMLEAADDHKLRVTTLMLLHFLLKNFASTHNTSVELNLREYAELRGMSTSRDALADLQDQVREDLYTLADIKAQWTEKRMIKTKSGKRRAVYEPTGYIRLNGGTVAVGRNVIRWNWNIDLLPSLQTLAPVDFPVEYFKLPAKGNSYPFAHYIALNYRRNEDKDSRNKIRIDTLLKEGRGLPSKEQLKAMKRASVKSHLIEPFFRDLNRVPRLAYELFKVDGTKVDDPKKLSLEDFLSAYIIVDYSAYPTHKHRIEQKSRHEETKNKIKEAAKLANAVKTAKRDNEAQ